MRSKSNKIWWLTGITLAGIGVFGAKKFKAAAEVLKNLQYEIKKVSDIKFGFRESTVNVELRIINPTHIQFGFTATSRIFLKQARLLDNTNQVLGVADLQLSEIILPANSKTLLPPISVTLNTAEALSEFTNNLQSYANNDFSRLSIELDIKAFGRIFTITEKLENI